jgi:SPW repeat
MFMKVKHWQDGVNLVAALWLLVSPWALGYAAETRPTWNAVIFGVLIGVIALYALFRVFAWEEWVNALFGAWMIISPWVLGFSGNFAVMLNAVIVGVVVLALAIWALGTDKDIGGWWSPAH